MLLEIARIKATPEAQPRVSLHYPTVEEYAEALRGRAEFPPVVVFHDGKDYWLADGFHRLEAYKKEDRTKIPVEVRNGTKRDAILFSVGANYKHGLPRTNEDKRRAVETLLRDGEWRRKSDSWIAQATKVDQKTVFNRRRHLESTKEIPKSEEREGLDGRTCSLPERRQRPDPPSNASSTKESAAHRPEVAPESERLSANGSPARQPQPPAQAPQASTDPFCGCGSAMRLQAVQAWVEQGEMIFKVLGETGRDHMLNEWAKRVKRLEGYAA